MFKDDVVGIGLIKVCDIEIHRWYLATYFQGNDG
nr:MAG TPA: hypothetical protein [Herelleviridae sp. ctUqP11]